MSKFVYSFGDGKSEGDASMKNLLGGKGANLAEMSNLALPVPPGFTITTEVCTEYYKNNETYPKGLNDQVKVALLEVENIMSAKFGDEQNPLLVSVRSGARVSMPGMMDTVLNLGLNDKTVEGLSKNSNNPRFAWDSYRRFVQMYADVVLEVDHHYFEEIIDIKKEQKNIVEDTDLDVQDLKDLVAQFKAKVKEQTNKDFPDNPDEQLKGAINAVFQSWSCKRAITYRKINDIPAQWGTAVNVQSMVFGNMGEDSATGVAFTRNPSTGDKSFYGEYLINAQGEDVVAGIRTPQPITLKAKQEGGDTLPAMEEVMPEVYQELVDVYQKLEAHYRDMQDIEFTVQNKKLWMLQTRSGKRTAAAAIKIAVDMTNEGLISKQEAILRVEPESLDQLLHPSLDPNAKKNVLAKGLPASPGAASGLVVFNSEEAEKQASQNKKVILVRIETSPEDIAGMHASTGILTARGGMTSHAAVVARGMGKPCVSGCGAINISYKNKTFSIGNKVFKEGDVVTINGGTGEIFEGKIPTVQANLSDDFNTIMTWSDEIRSLKIRTNAETSADVQVAKNFGAEGIGLCRTEHMFFDAERIINMRQMILAENKAGREEALKKLLPVQKSDFEEIFKIMKELPVTIRLLDPPLHEFLPHKEEEIQEVSKAANISVEKIKKQIAALSESNPMLGHRGCRLGITYPEIYQMQVRAIFEAVININKTENLNIVPEIMIPLVFGKAELNNLKAKIIEVEKQVSAENNVKINYLLGTMIELPRAALKAGEIAQEAEFFSFGTNDLTQTSFGISRDDSANFINQYKDKNIVEHDPFVTLDTEGVGELIKIASERGRVTRKDIKLGICGEHGGNPASIEFCNSIGLNYVSCSPYRVPIARLAAAQATLKK